MHLMNRKSHHAGHHHAVKEHNAVFSMVALFVPVYPIISVTRKPDVVPNVLSIQIARLRRRALTNVAKIHVKHQLVASMQNVVFTITRPTVTVTMDLWEMLSFTAYQFHRSGTQLPIHVCHHHVYQEASVKCMET